MPPAPPATRSTRSTRSEREAHPSASAGAARRNLLSPVEPLRAKAWAGQNSPLSSTAIICHWHSLERAVASAPRSSSTCASSGPSSSSASRRASSRNQALRLTTSTSVNPAACRRVAMPPRLSRWKLSPVEAMNVSIAGECGPSSPTSQSAIARRPPGTSTRCSSPYSAALSSMWHIASLLKTTSNVASPTGNGPGSTSWNDTVPVRPAAATLRLARSIAKGSTSSPSTCAAPRSPAMIKQQPPSPLPTSSTRLPATSTRSSTRRVSSAPPGERNPSPRNSWR